MRVCPRFGLFAVSVGALILGAVAACSSPDSDGESDLGNGSVSGLTDTVGSTSTTPTSSGKFDPNQPIVDAVLLNKEAMTVASVQKFLDATPWGTSSPLAKYTESGQTAAEIMVITAQKYGLNPLAMLVRAQAAEGLISAATAEQSVIDYAFGCGCADGAACDETYKGFAAQAKCAAATLSNAMKLATNPGEETGGWEVGKPKTTSDGVEVTPANAATAALYTYTPFVGESGGGKAGVGGVSLHVVVWDTFADATGLANSAGTALGKGAVTSASDAGASNVEAGATPVAPGEVAPPPSNAVPPKAKTPTKPESLPKASEAELASKARTKAGCSASGSGFSGSGSGAASAWLVVLGIALASARRRRFAFARN